MVSNSGTLSKFSYDFEMLVQAETTNEKCSYGFNCWNLVKTTVRNIREYLRNICTRNICKHGFVMLEIFVWFCNAGTLSKPQWLSVWNGGTNLLVGLLAAIENLPNINDWTDEDEEAKSLHHGKFCFLFSNSVFYWFLASLSWSELLV